MRYLLISILALCGICGSAAIKHSDFARSSKLSSGNWVKIGVDKTGIYEISYEALRNMGFSNPQNVGLYGIGGKMHSKDFTNAVGTIVYKDDLQPVAVYHHNDKIYFYGLGTEDYKLYINSVLYEGGGYYEHTSKNIYTDTGYYFLSDSENPKIMEKVNSTGTSSLTEYKIGVGLYSHHVDLYHNNSNTGQLFYGEKMSADKPRLEWDIQLPGALPGSKGAMECHIYTDKIKDTRVMYGFDGAEDFANIKVGMISTSDFLVHSPVITAMSVPSATPRVFTEIDFNGESMDVSNVDFWTISYARTIPTLIAPDGTRLSQERIAFPKIPRPQSGKIRIPNGINRLVFDISDPANTKRIDLFYDGTDGIAKLTYKTNIPEIIVFDPLMPQLQIKSIDGGATYIKNQNLHEQAAAGADLIIICIPSLKEAAERLADVHRANMGQRVIVATTEEAYNEFSAGIPDPIAYRALAKMAYTSEYGCKNLLLLGPLYADFRGISVDKNPHDGIIAVQSTVTNQERGGFNTNDYYGMMQDYIGTKVLEQIPVQIGVGILPARYPAEVDTYVKKVEDYTTRTDFAYTLNRYLMMGGYGDADLHSAQVPEMEKYLHNFENYAAINTQLAVDAYGYKEGHDKLFKTVDEGISVMTYFGHGNPIILNHEGNFFTASDVYLFRNKTLPFWGFAGCELSEPDKGVRGMGESMVLSTPYGMIGSLLATRETWSSQNLDFFKRFHGTLLRDGGLPSSPMYRNAPTIGEVYAKTKQLSTYANELAYQLLCDPAIVIPTVNREIILESGSLSEAVPGEWLEISGYVKGYDNDDADTDFSGEVVVRLMEPTRTEACPHLILSKDPSESLPQRPVLFDYAETQLAMASAKVTGGYFNLRLMVPLCARDFGNQNANLHLAAYDPSTRLGAAARTEAIFIPSEGSSTLSEDETPPVVEIFEYDAKADALRIRVSDDTALAYDSNPLRPPFRLRIDGKEYKTGATTNPVIDSENMAYEKTVHLSDILEGSHSAWITVRDAAGNDTQAEIVFDYQPLSARYAITLEQRAVDGSGRIMSVGEAPSKADIIIMNNNGSLVMRAPFASGEYIWNACDVDGIPVPPGLYKAYIIETGEGNSKGHSETITIPVI